MVKCSDENLDTLFGALSEPVRRSVVRTLANGERTVSQLAEPHKMTMAAVMKHISILEKAGLVKTEKRGRIRYCRLQVEPFDYVQEWLTDTTAFWNRRLSALARFVEDESTPTLEDRRN